MHTSFDTSGTSLPTRVVRVNQIVDLLHVSHAQQQIADYRQAMRDGSRFPPISVIRLGHLFFITDGHKRFAAASDLGMKEMAVELWTVRELTADLLAQLGRHSRAGWRAVTGLHHGREARREGALFAVSTLLHWRRMATSLWILIVRPRKSRDPGDVPHPSAGGSGRRAG